MSLYLPRVTPQRWTDLWLAVRRREVHFDWLSSPCPRFLIGWPLLPLVWLVDAFLYKCFGICFWNLIGWLLGWLYVCVFVYSECVFICVCYDWLVGWLIMYTCVFVRIHECVSICMISRLCVYICMFNIMMYGLVCVPETDWQFGWLIKCIYVCMFVCIRECVYTMCICWFRVFVCICMFYL